MSVGGVVAEIVPVDPARWWIGTIDQNELRRHLDRLGVDVSVGAVCIFLASPPSDPSPLAVFRDTLAALFEKRIVGVYCDPKDETITVGDGLWWQGPYCFYTPRVEPDGRVDVKLPKLSGSGVARPDLE